MKRIIIMAIKMRKHSVVITQVLEGRILMIILLEWTKMIILHRTILEVLNQPRPSNQKSIDLHLHPSLEIEHCCSPHHLLRPFVLLQVGIRHHRHTFDLILLVMLAISLKLRVYYHRNVQPNKRAQVFPDSTSNLSPLLEDPTLRSSLTQLIKSYQGCQCKGTM